MCAKRVSPGAGQLRISSQPLVIDLAIIGGGVRSVVMLLQLATFSTEHLPQRIAVIDPERPGAGRIWRETQSTLLVMNTLGHQSTVFEDHRNTGPTLAEWCRLVRGETARASTGWPPGLEEHVRAWGLFHPEAIARVVTATSKLADESYFPRSVFGTYLNWAYDYAVERLPSSTEVAHLCGSVSDVAEEPIRRDESAGYAEPPSGVHIVLHSGATVRASRVVLATGWGVKPDATSNPASARIDHLHITANSPIDQDLSQILPTSRLLIRGLGMSMFDTLTLLTQGRGGRFVRREGQLEYAPSGEEPSVLLGSRRGIPFRSQAKPSKRSMQPEMPHLTELMTRLPREGVDFAEVQEAMTRDAMRRFHQVAHAGNADEAHLELIRDIDEGISLDRCSEREAQLISEPACRFPNLHTAASVPAHIDSPEDYAAWVHEVLRTDIAESERGERSPGKMALEVLIAARTRMSDIVGFGRLTANSYPSFLSTMRLIGAVGGVPPLFRVEELEALVRAGVVRFLGPDTTVETLGSGRFLAHSRFMSAEVDAVVDAFLPRPGFDRSDDVLARQLRERGSISRYRYADSIDTDAIAIDPADNALISADGVTSQRVFSVGLASEAARVFTIIAPVPGTDSPVLRECRGALSAALGYAARKPVSA